MNTHDTDASRRMSPKEVMRVVNRYIGVSGGYLADFSYRTHADFYPEYCDLDIDPGAYEGTTRERFIAILSSLLARDQAKVLRGVLERFPLETGPDTRPAARDEIATIIQRLDSGPLVATVDLRVSSDVVARALTDAETLLATSGAISSVDRLHTALHGYLIAACDSAFLPHQDQASMAAIFKVLRAGHPKLTNLGPRSQDIDRILHSCAAILDAMNPVRNQASVAHPNPSLLGEEEARLVINTVRTLLTYLDAKLG